MFQKYVELITLETTTKKTMLQFKTQINDFKKGEEIKTLLKFILEIKNKNFLVMYAIPLGEFSEILSIFTRACEFTVMTICLPPVTTA